MSSRRCWSKGGGITCACDGWNRRGSGRTICSKTRGRRDGCGRRLEQTRQRQNNLFEDRRQLESLWAIEEWAQQTTDGSLADLPALPDSGVWDRVRAEHGNCLGK